MGWRRVTAPPKKKDMGPVKVLWYGDEVPPSRKGHGTSGWKHYRMEYPPVDRQAPVKTVLSPAPPPLPILRMLSLTRKSFCFSAWCELTIR